MGALAGHMDHLYENPSLTFNKIKEIFQAAAHGELEGTEKTDGQNLYISYSAKDGKAKAARNKGNIKEGGLDAKGLANKFAEHANPKLILTFTEAFGAFEKAVNLFPPEEQIEIFGPDANIFYNAEIQDPRAANVIDYDTKNLVIHRSGHAEFDRESAKITDRDVSNNAARLEAVLESVQDQLALEEYGVQINAIRRLKELDDKKVLKIATKRLEKEISAEGISDNQTIADYMISRIDNIIKHQIKLSPQTQEELLRRIMKQPSSVKENSNATVNTVLSTIPKEDKETKNVVRQLINDAKVILKTAIYPIEDVIHDFSVEMLRGLKSAFIVDNESEVERVKVKVQDAIAEIESGSRGKAGIGKLQQEMMKLKDVENVSTATEGFVFDFDDHTYKFTGNFAPINQILGIFKYDRVGEETPPIQISEGIDIDVDKADVALYPGAFKPPHKGHIEVIKQLLDKADKVIVLISNPMGKTRSMPLSGKVISAEDSAEIWKKYIKGLSKVEIQVSPDPSPVTATMTYVGDPVSDGISSAPEGATVILGCGDKGSDIERYKDVQRYARDDVKVEVFGCPCCSKHSPEYLNVVASNPEIYNMLPSTKKGLDINDFHASDMRYLADLSATSDVADELVQDFVPGGTSYKNILSILGVEKKRPIMETLFSLVEECLNERACKSGTKWTVCSHKTGDVLPNAGKFSSKGAAEERAGQMSRAKYAKMEESEDIEEQTEPFQRFAKGTYVKMVGDLAKQGPNKHNVGGKMKKASNKNIKSAPPGGGAMEEGLEEEKELDEASSAAAGSAQMGGGATWKGLDVKKANKREKRRSKSTMSTIKQALVGEDQIVEEIADYLLKMMPIGAKK